MGSGVPYEKRDALPYQVPPERGSLDRQGHRRDRIVRTPTLGDTHGLQFEFATISHIEHGDKYEEIIRVLAGFVYFHHLHTLLQTAQAYQRINYNSFRGHWWKVE